MPTLVDHVGGEVAGGPLPGSSMVEDLRFGSCAMAALAALRLVSAAAARSLLHLIPTRFISMVCLMR